MKNLKKVLALVVATLISVASMSVAFADATELRDYAIVIDTTAENHTYKVYTIFTGDLSEDGNTLSNIVWGNGITDAGKTQLYSVYGLTGADQTAAKVAEKVAEDDDAQAFAEAINSYLQNAQSLTAISGDGVIVDGETKTSGYYIESLNSGYYLIKDEQNNNVTGSDDFYSNFIVEVLDNVVATPKGSTTTVEKKTADDVADDTDISSIEETAWQDIADYDIGDKVPFQLTATLGTTITDYKTYVYTFHDTLSSGLTFDATSWSFNFLGETWVAAGGKTINGDTVTVAFSKAAVTEGEPAEETGETALTWTVTITGASNGKIAAGEEGTAVNGSQGIVTYKATLNKDAVIGHDGNLNEVYLTYSNNPNGDGTGETAPDEVGIFTYKVKITKVNGNAPTYAYMSEVDYDAADTEVKEGYTENPDYDSENDSDATSKYRKVTGYTALNAADFELYKVTDETLAGNIESETLNDEWFTTNEDNLSQITGDGATDAPSKSIDGTTYADSHEFIFTGLDDGIYVLRETQTPDGFNSVDPIAFQVTVEHDAEADEITNSVITSINGNAKNGEITLTPINANGELDADIANFGGAVLPSTGGIGTTIFYVGGSILVLAAVILLVTKRRMSAED